MNFTVYLNKETGETIARAAKHLHRSRNSIIAEALDEWLNRHVLRQWPKSFFNFPPAENVPDFKAFRKELKDIPEDPLS